MTSVTFSGCFSFHKHVIGLVIQTAHRAAHAANNQQRRQELVSRSGREYEVAACVKFRKNGPQIGFYAKEKPVSNRVTPYFPVFFQEETHQRMAQLEDAADAAYAAFLTKQGLTEGKDYTYKRHAHPGVPSKERIHLAN